MRVGFSPSSKSNIALASSSAAVGTRALTSPQPVILWFVSISTYTLLCTRCVFIAVMRMLEAESATPAAGFFSWAIASFISHSPAIAPAELSAARRVNLPGEDVRCGARVFVCVWVMDGSHRWLKGHEAGIVDDPVRPFQGRCVDLASSPGCAAGAATLGFGGATLSA